MKRSEILGLEGAAVNQEGLQYYLFFVYKSYMYKQKKSLSHAAWATKPFGIVHESVFRHQSEPAKGVTWSSSMRSSWNSPLLGTTIWSTPSELRYVIRGTPAWCVTQKTVDHWTMPCTRNKPSHCWKYRAMHLISVAGTMAPTIWYYIHLYGILQTHVLPHQEKHYQC